MVVHEAHDAHREALGRGHHAVGEGERLLARDRRGRGCRAEALELALGERAEHDDAVGEARGDRRRGVADRRRAAATAAAPLHVGEAQLGQAEGGGQARRVIAVVAVGGEAVDLAGVDPGVLAGAQDGPERQLELRLRRLAVLVVRGLADADDGDLTTESALAHVSR